MWAPTGSSRQVVKQTLSVTKINILYARITLTRFTTLYFSFAVITCIILSGLQGVTFTDNSNAISALTSIIGNNSIDDGIVVLDKNTLRLCDSIPRQAGTNCTDILVFGSTSLQNGFEQSVTLDSRDSDEGDGDSDSDKEGEDDHSEDDQVPAASGETSNSGNGGVALPDSSTTNTSLPLDTNSSLPLDANSSLPLDPSCILSLRWLDETIQDAQREDVVTFGFELWLFVLALVTILNESIPHLVAAVFGHILGSAWSGYRIHSTQRLRSIYKNYIVPDACDNRDLLGNWWDVRIRHAIPVVVMNCIALVALSLLSVKLFQVYTTASFSRVGASAKIHRIYKIVLLFSMCLQLSGFFSVAATSMWIDRVCHGAVMELAEHSKSYLAAFIVALVVIFPWLYLGWVCVRKECKIRFGIFVVISGFLLVISTLMFQSPLYRFIFVSWPLFATMTITAYVLTVVTTILAIFCRLNFEKGLAHYLQVTDALEGMDFTPVVFSKDDDRDLEKYDITDSKLASINASSAPLTVRLPPTAFTTAGQIRRGQSVYSDQGSAVYLSSSPPLVSELTPAPNRLSRASSTRTVSTVPSYPLLTTLRAGAGTGEREGNGKRKSAAARALAAPVPATRLSAAVAEVRRSNVSSESSSRSILPISPSSPPLKKLGLPSNPRLGSGRSSPA